MNRQLSYVGCAGDAATLPEVLRLRAEQSGDDPFVTFGEQTLSFGQALVRAELAASGLSGQGIGKGDAVAVMLPNCLEFLDLWFGTALIGATLVPVNFGLRGDGLRYVIEHSDAEVAIVDESVAAVVDSVFDDASGPGRRFVRGQASGWEPVEELLAGGPRVDWQTFAPGDVASVLYTSGTTGLPKGVVNCHNAYVAAGCEFAKRYVDMRADDILYTTLPLFHVNAQMLTTMGAILSGRPMILAPRFSASGFVDDLRAHGATVFNYIGAMLTMIAKQPERPDDSANPARLAVGGAAPTNIWQPFERRFGLTVLEIYGLTETATFCLGSPPDDIRVGKIGVPVGWSEVKVADEDGAEVEPGETGEILVRSVRPDVLFKGYYKNPEATAEAMRDGWFHSGDRGVCDEDGYFAFVDRLKDCIRRRGENISSYEIERIVNSHPEVAESAAVAVPSDLGEDEVMVHVVPRPGAKLEMVELIAFCEERMALFMVPRYLRVRESLPKTATERVQKFELRAEGVDSAWDRLAASS